MSPAQLGPVPARRSGNSARTAVPVPGPECRASRPPSVSTRSLGPQRLQTQRDRLPEVLALMAEGLSNAGIAHRLWLAEGTIEKHVRSILTKLGIAEAAESHRRVLAVLTFLGNN
jgi:DNA-binding NarL/FixJ family response regulator